jgi:hypothetical protein
MSRNLDRWIRAMRERYGETGVKQQQPTVAEITAAHDVIADHAFRSMVASLKKKRQPRRTPKIKTAEALLELHDPAPPDAREQFEAKIRLCSPTVCPTVGYRAI